MSLNHILTYSLSSVGLLTLFYKLFKYIRMKQLRASYFKDKVVLITGASSGLGKGLAEELYPLGAQLILCARNYEELSKVKENLKKRPGKEPEILCMDVSCPLEEMKPKIESLYKKFPRIHILVNNAGITYRGKACISSDETFRKIMDVNFFGLFRLTNLILNNMIEENKKSNSKRSIYSIVNIGSVQSYIGIPYRSAYCASKHALLAYSDALRAELCYHPNIDVINVQPGYINTNISINALSSDGSKNNTNDDDHRNGYQPEYVARVITNSILNRDKEVIVAILLHKFAIWLRFFFPNLFFWAMKIRAKTSEEKKYQ